MTTQSFNKANSTSNRSGINIGRNRSNSDTSSDKSFDGSDNSSTDISSNNNNNNNNNNTNNGSTVNAINGSLYPALIKNSNNTYSTMADFKRSELDLAIKSLKYFDKNRLYSNIKCTIIGISGVGKTSFIRRFSSGEFLIDETTTFGAIRTLHMNHYSGLSLNLEIWDSGGHDRLKGLLPFYLTGTNCMMLMFDVTSKESFRKAFDLLSKSKSMVAAGSMFLVVGNKLDCTKREITTEELKAECEKRSEELDINISWCEISARTGYNIHEPFNIISKTITTMINIIKVSHRSLNNSGNSIPTSGEGEANKLEIDSINKSTFKKDKPTNNNNNNNNNSNNLPSFFELDEESTEDNDMNSSFNIISNPDIIMIRNNNYSCIERTKSVQENVIVKLDSLKIVIEPSINTIFNKILSMHKKTLFFKEANDNSDSGELNGSPNGSGGVTGVTGGSSGSSGEKGSFCIVVDKYHPKRIEFRRRSSPLTNNSEDILLCDYRDHLIKTFISLCPYKIPIIEGSNSTTINDFIGYFNECLRYHNRGLIEKSYIEKCNKSNNVSLSSAATTSMKSNETLINLEFSKMLKDEKYISALSNAINWNASIETLDISDNKFDNYEIKIFNDLLQSINNSISIINLNLANNSLNSKHKNSLIEFIQAMKLKSLNLNNNNLSNNCNLIAQTLTQNTTLTHLSLSNNNLNNDNAQSLSQMIQQNSTIQSIDLSENKIEDEGAAFLLNAQKQQQNSNSSFQLSLNLQLNPTKFQNLNNAKK
ncbi:hypothetical protein DICPUDRAFT_84055 [Dictyostelium purpureum]|uniref:Uncharacterized protein n=1 Tax=Dictyostelium purpureum TaxID=5786 RepID=F1A1G2_DICPU|nr:uncharacterized protein DICPUDRAFT_84055 [Dictyostelium purpureum]EGC29964.1 hypothetical protein DICPUDRAFT_84055 [Dictyostelium purpureum]|eukprot:XP_003293503.1 hypothetical protein DICPUDRAFT_84055 [Dictyostelium purpureum]